MAARFLPEAPLPLARLAAEHQAGTLRLKLTVRTSSPLQSPLPKPKCQLQGLGAISMFVRAVSMQARRCHCRLLLQPQLMQPKAREQTGISFSMIHFISCQKCDVEHMHQVLAVSHGWRIAKDADPMGSWRKDIEDFVFWDFIAWHQLLRAKDEGELCAQVTAARLIFHTSCCKSRPPPKLVTRRFHEWVSQRHCPGWCRAGMAPLPNAAAPAGGVCPAQYNRTVTFKPTLVISDCVSS